MKVIKQKHCYDIKYLCVKDRLFSHFGHLGMCVLWYTAQHLKTWLDTHLNLSVYTLTCMLQSANACACALLNLHTGESGLFKASNFSIFLLFQSSL